LAEQGQGCGCVAGDGALGPTGLVGGLGEVFGPQVVGEVLGCGGEVFGL
jgi:hypothetical protein